jgi:hypothetical protein
MGLWCKRPFHNVSVTTKNGPSIIFNNAAVIEIDNVKSLLPIAAHPVIVFNEVSGAFVHNVWPVQNTRTYLTINGAGSKDILVKYNNFSGITKPVVQQFAAQQNIVIE